MKFADLHLHTDFSDGTQPPAVIVAKALEVGLSCVAITDHDTTEALDEARRAAGGKLEVLSGIELTADLSGQEIHLLGYLIDDKSEAFQKKLKVMKENRVKRIHLMCRKLKKLGVNLEAEEVLALAGRGTAGRLHVARLMHKKGYIASIPEAFSRYIGNTSPAYISRFKMTPKEAIGWIVKMGGVPVLAHPYTLGSHALISDYVKMGVRGLEVYYPQHSEYQIQEFIKIAQKHQLVITGGSDYHGGIKKEVYLGKVKIPYQYVEDLREAKCSPL